MKIELTRCLMEIPAFISYRVWLAICLCNRPVCQTKCIRSEKPCFWWFSLWTGKPNGYVSRFYIYKSILGWILYRGWIRNPLPSYSTVIVHWSKNFFVNTNDESILCHRNIQRRRFKKNTASCCAADSRKYIKEKPITIWLKIYPFRKSTRL